MEEEIKKYISMVRVLSIIGVVVWILIIIYQIIVGLILSLFGYGIAMLGCAGWNIYQTVKEFKFIASLSNYTTIAEVEWLSNSFKNAIANDAWFILINFFLGGGLGVVANIYAVIIDNVISKRGRALVESWSYGSVIS